MPRRLTPQLAYTAGVAAASAAGFFSPMWFFGFIPLAAGLVWASYDLVDDGEEVAGGDTASTPSRR